MTENGEAIVHGAGPDHIGFSVTAGVARISLDRPEAGNAFTLPMARAFAQAAQRCSADPAIAAVILAAEGPAFCYGGDLGAFAQSDDGGLAEMVGHLNAAVSDLLRMRKPLVTLINGPASGAGVSLAILGDIVLAAKSAYFKAGYSLVGLSPDGGLTWLLPRVIGLRRAQDMIFTNRRIDSAEALAWGLVTRTTDDDALASEGAALAERLANGPTAAMGITRALLLESGLAGLEDHLQREAAAIVSASRSPEGLEGIDAFLTKRAPAFGRL